MTDGVVRSDTAALHKVVRQIADSAGNLESSWSQHKESALRDRGGVLPALELMQDVTESWGDVIATQHDKLTELSEAFDDWAKEVVDSDEWNSGRIVEDGPYIEDDQGGPTTEHGPYVDDGSGHVKPV